MHPSNVRSPFHLNFFSIDSENLFKGREGMNLLILQEARELIDGSFAPGAIYINQNLPLSPGMNLS